MKKCKNCKYFTGVFCHGHGDYWGECKKNRNTLFCYEDTPCLQDVKTLRQIYFEQKEEIEKIKYNNTSLEIWKARYEIKSRHLQKIENCWYLATKYIPKEKYKEYRKELLQILTMSSEK